MKTLLMSVFILITSSTVAQTRRVVIYPLTHNCRDFTFSVGANSHIGTRCLAIVVPADEMDKLYAIHCDATKRWDHCHETLDNAYWADVKGHHMNIWAQWEGNQHKGYSDKFIIDDITQSAKPFKDVQDIDAFKKSDAFQKLTSRP